MNIKKIFYSLLLLSSGAGISTTSIGGDVTTMIKPQHMILSVSGGAAVVPEFGQSKNFPIINPLTDSFYNYTSNHAGKTVGLADGFIGGEWIVAPKWLMQLGIDFNQIANLSDQGTLLQGADLPSSNLYRYNYSVTSRQLLIQSKFSYQVQQRYYPYILFGLGAAFNTAYDFKTSVPQSLAFTRNYSNHQQTTFSYNLGLGIDVAATDNLRVGIGYRFADRGHASLGNATIDTTSVSGTLPQVRLYSNEIFGQLTLVI